MGDGALNESMVGTPPPATAEQGLGGSMVSQPDQPTAENGPATNGPADPGQQLSLHIMAALGGSNGKPMDWAKATLAGVLGAGAVGKVPEGGGWLAGITRGAGNFEAQRQERMARQQQANQQQFENALKSRQDARAEKELSIHEADSTAQRAMWNAQTAVSVQTRQQNAARFGDLQKEDKLRVQQLETEINKSENDQLSILAAAGVDITKLDHVTGVDQVSQDHIKQAGAGSVFAVPNGQPHEAGEDGAGAYIVPGNIWDSTISKPLEIIGGYEVDKNGNAKPKMITAQAGTRVGTLLAVAKGAQADLMNKQKMILDKADIAQKNAAAFKDTEEGKLAQANAGTMQPTTDILGGTINPPAGGIKEANKIHDSFKKDADNLAKTEGTFNQFQDILNDINSGKGMTGAQSVVALFNAIGISAEPLQGKGFRINHNIVSEHEEARGLGQGLYQKLLKLKDGDVITPQQVKDYAEIAMRSRHDAYVNKINEARGQGIDPSFLLPRGNGKHIDHNTGSIFYDTAAGNTPQEKAANALKASTALGWQ